MEAELWRVKDVKRDSTLQIFVKRIEISVSLDNIKVIFILFDFNFLNPILVLSRKSFQLFARSSTWKKTFLATSFLTHPVLSSVFPYPLLILFVTSCFKPTWCRLPQKKQSRIFATSPMKTRKIKPYFPLSEKRSFSNPRQGNATFKKQCPSCQPQSPRWHSWRENTPCTLSR